MNACTECITYKIRHNQMDLEVCPECGKKTFEWKQHSTGSFYLECSNCLCLSAVDLHTICEEDPVFWQRIKIVVEPQSGRHGNKAILEIALFFHENSLQMRQKLIEGYSFEPPEGEIDTIINFFEQHDILYRIISPPDPRDKYLYYKECNYLHSQMKKYKNGSVTVI